MYPKPYVQIYKPHLCCWHVSILSESWCISFTFFTVTEMLFQPGGRKQDRVITCWRWVDTLFFNQSTIQSTIHLIPLKKIRYILYIQETDKESLFIKARHSLCLGLESLPRLPGLLLCCRLLVAVNQNPDEPQLQDDDQHVHHYLGNHRRQLRCRCGGHNRWIMSHVSFHHARSGCLRLWNDLSKAFHVKLLTLNVKSGRLRPTFYFNVTPWVFVSFCSIYVSCQR